MAEHKITTENILAAAEKCPQAKETLKTMFPEAFKNDRFFDLTMLKPNPINDLSGSLFDESVINKIGIQGSTSFMWVSKNHEYNGAAITLSKNCEWEIKVDDDGYKTLIPTRK